GTFLATVGASGCGGYNLGANFSDDSSTTWGPGTTISQTIGGDDVSTSSPRTISAYDFGFVSFTGTGLTLGDTVTLGNGVGVGSQGVGGGGEAMVFQVVPVPAAAWLFGSALGLLGWARRRVV
ncbi:MAG TPA: VPLPA-CTERM sorting domain-containing protein, partial [Gammaproteobacteria bacterium]|nr:VPLPA-CTERM sorting domain-containing protein [Gammaproteobacteria bacterium]